MSVIHALLTLIMALIAGRSEANCFSSGPHLVTQSQKMENCADMDAKYVTMFAVGFVAPDC